MRQENGSRDMAPVCRVCDAYKLDISKIGACCDIIRGGL